MRSIRTTLAAAALLGIAATAATPAAALDLEAMTEAEEAAFGEAVRAYLLANPEVMMEVFAILEEREQQAQADMDRQLVQLYADAIFEDGYSWVGGNPEGDVTLVEFIDYRCSFCRRAHPEVTELVASDGNIRKIVKEFPILGEESVEASRFAIATRLVAGDAAYGEVRERLITHRGAFDRAAFSRIGTELGLDAEAIVAAMDAPEVGQVIAANHALAREMNITGTPTYVLGEGMVRGYVPLQGMREIVSEARGG